jgi:hypothetical protein
MEKEEIDIGIRAEEYAYEEIREKFERLIRNI